MRFNIVSAFEEGEISAVYPQYKDNQQTPIIIFNCNDGKGDQRIIGSGAVKKLESMWM